MQCNSDAFAIDTRATAKSYTINAWPTYFLIDKTGKVVSDFANKLPDEPTINRLLAVDRPE